MSKFSDYVAATLNDRVSRQGVTDPVGLAAVTATIALAEDASDMPLDAADSLLACARQMTIGLSFLMASGFSRASLMRFCDSYMADLEPAVRAEREARCDT